MPIEITDEEKNTAVREAALKLANWRRVHGYGPIEGDAALLVEFDRLRAEGKI